MFKDTPQTDPQIQYNAYQMSVLFCLFCRNWQADLKIYMEVKGTRIARIILKSKNNMEDVHFLFTKLPTNYNK